MTKLLARFRLSFLFCFVLEISVLSASSQFNVHINERGTHFNEKVNISENQNTVSFKVPKHNNVNRAEVLNDFKLKLTITRLPDLGICHIKPLDRGMPNPKEMKADMNYLKKERAQLKGMNMVLSSTEWAIDRRIKREDLSPSFAKFCAGYPVYLLKEFIDDDLVTVDRNDTVSRRKRQSNFQLCPNSYANTPCNPNEWILNCKFVNSNSRIRTCVYWMKCKHKVGNINNINECDFTHNWTSVMCCIPTCP